MKLFVSFFIFGFLFAVSVQAQPVCPNYQVVSPLEEQTQEQVDWCTFAAARVVMSHYGLAKSQCELVEDLVNYQPCCKASPLDPVDPPCHPDPPLWPHDVFNSSTVSYFYSQIGVNSMPLSWIRIVKEICEDNRPLLAVATSTTLYEADNPNWHAVVVEGYKIESTGEQKVRVFDPQEDLCDVPDFPSSCTEQNPRFVNYDYFFLSEVTHLTDYYDIRPNNIRFLPASFFLNLWQYLKEQF